MLIKNIDLSKGDKIRIGDATINIQRLSGDKIRVGITAPREVPVSFPEHPISKAIDS